MKWLVTLLAKLRPRIRLHLKTEFDTFLSFDPDPLPLKANDEPRGLKHAADELVESTDGRSLPSARSSTNSSKRQGRKI